MISWIKDVFRRDRGDVDDELAFAERRGETGRADSTSSRFADDAEMNELRATVDALRKVGGVNAPRSYALTPETLTDAGYSQLEINRILGSGIRPVPLWHRPVVRQLPLAVTALALLVGGYFAFAGSTDLLSPTTVPVTTVVEREARFAVTRQVEAEVEVEVQTVVIERDVESLGSMAPVTVEVERLVEVTGETILQTVVVEREVMVEREVQAEVTGEAQVTREVEVEVEREVTRVADEMLMMEDEVSAEVTAQVAVTRVVEREVQAEVTGEPQLTREAAGMMMDEESAELQATVAAAPTWTPAPAGLMPSATATVPPEPTPTATPQPTVRPTQTPVPTATTVPELPVVLFAPSPTAEVPRVTEGPETDSGIFPARMLTLVVAIAVALAGLAVWFELRRRRLRWE